MTRLLGVIGDPIAHSLSPLIHNGWLRDMKFNAVYEAFQVPVDGFEDAVQTLKARDLLGLNVTLPHKKAALALADTVSPAATKIGAVNTLTLLPDGTLKADNTDAPGFLASVGSLNPHTDKVVILGAGGSARAVVYGLSEMGIELVVLNRTVERAKALIDALGRDNSVYGNISQYKEYMASATIVINTTSMGHGGAIMKLPPGKDRLFYDISYGAVAQPQLQHARDRGWRTQDGLAMLVAQAAHSFQIWFGELPDMDTALERCRTAVRATL